MDNLLDALQWRDELLQILYWFRGEGLGEIVAAHDLLPFLSAPLPLIQQHLNELVDDGYATQVPSDPPSYQLTSLGVKEGGRRFADEFTGLTGQAHGECNNPNCSCKTLGPQACEGRHVHA